MVHDGEPQDFTSELVDDHGSPKTSVDNSTPLVLKKPKPEKLKPGGLRSPDPSQDASRWEYAYQFTRLLRKIELGSESDRPVVLCEIRDTVLPLYATYLLTGRGKKDLCRVMLVFNNCLAQHDLTASESVREVLFASLEVWALDPKSRDALYICRDALEVDYPDTPELVVRSPDPDAKFAEWFASAQADLKRIWNERMQAYREAGWQTRAAKHSPEHFRAAVWHQVGGLTYSEIASRFYIPFQTVKEVIPEILLLCGFPARPPGRRRRPHR
jgi:hypothetical protein